MQKYQFWPPWIDEELGCWWQLLNVCHQFFVAGSWSDCCHTQLTLTPIAQQGITSDSGEGVKTVIYEIELRCKYQLAVPSMWHLQVKFSRVSHPHPFEAGSLFHDNASSKQHVLHENYGCMIEAKNQNHWTQNKILSEDKEGKHQWQDQHHLLPDQHDVE